VARLRFVQRLRLDGDMRSGDRVHVNAGVGRAPRGGVRTAQGAPGVPPLRGAGRGRQGPRHDGDWRERAARRPDDSHCLDIVDHCPVLRLL
jgi:hypothetical protein